MLPERHAVTSFLESDNEILILLRSEHVSTYPGKWAGISGSVDKGKTVDEQAVLEIEEETGLSGDQLKLVKKGQPLSFYDVNLTVRKVIHVYLFHIEDRSKIRIDWEHREMKWIKPEDIDNYDVMPKLKEVLGKVIS